MPRHRPLVAERLEPRDLPAAPFNTLPVVPQTDVATTDTVHAIIARGRALGRDPTALLNAGDSNSAQSGGITSGYLIGFGNPAYNPVASGLAAVRPDLIDTLNAYRASGSFARSSTAAFPGFRAADLLRTLPGEIAATRAGVGLVMIGTNDNFAQTDPAEYAEQLRDIVRLLETAGIVPILSTIPANTLTGANAARVPVLNQIIADVAGEFHVPLWNLWRGLAALPGSGLAVDGTHLVYAGNGSSFTGGDLAAGQNLRNLEALEVLAWFRRTAAAPTSTADLTTTWTALDRGQTVVAAGRGEGQPPVVSVLDSAGREVNRFLAFDPVFTGGVRVATADVTGDGVPDVVAGAGFGGAPVVKVFSGADGAEVASFFAFESTFRSGVNVAAADLDGDGVAEVVAGAGDGGGPAVAVYRGGDFAEVSRFFAYESSFRGGVHVAAGDVAGVGPAIVTGAGTGGGPVVKAFRLGDAAPALAYFAYDPNVRSGVVVAVAGGDVATAPASGAPHVYIVNPETGAVRASFFAPVAGGFGVTLGTLRDASGTDALLIGNGPGAAVQAWAYRGGTTEPFGAGDPGRAYGVYVG